MSPALKAAVKVPEIVEMLDAVEALNDVSLRINLTRPDTVEYGALMEEFTEVATRLQNAYEACGRDF